MLASPPTELVVVCVPLSVLILMAALTRSSAQEPPSYFLISSNYSSDTVGFYPTMLFVVCFVFEYISNDLLLPGHRGKSRHALYK